MGKSYLRFDNEFTSAYVEGDSVHDVFNRTMELAETLYEMADMIEIEIDRKEREKWFASYLRGPFTWL